MIIRDRKEQLHSNLIRRSHSLVLLISYKWNSRDVLRNFRKLQGFLKLIRRGKGHLIFVNRGDILSEIWIYQRQDMTFTKYSKKVSWEWWMYEERIKVC